MKKSEYDALKLKFAAELQEVYEKNRSIVLYKTEVEREAGSVSWAIGKVLQGAYANNCKYHYAAAMDAIEDFSLHHWLEADADIEFEPEDLTGHHPKMLIIDEVSDWPANIEYKWHEIGHTIKLDTLSKGSDNEVPKFYGRSLSSFIEEIESESDAGQLLDSMTHPRISDYDLYKMAQMSASGPWPQLGITQIDSASPAQPYIPTYQAEPKEEKPPEDDGWGGNVKPQSAAEDFSAIAKRLKELAAEKENNQ